MIKAVARLWFCGLVFGASAVTAYFATNSTTLLAEARGIIPNAYGSVKAGVSSGMALTLEFSISAGKGYKAGAVTAATDSSGRLVRIVKQKQVCAVTYNPLGSVRSVKCSGSRRLLSDAAIMGGSVTNENDPGTASGQDKEETGQVARRLLAPSTCASCATLVFSSFSSKIKAFCSAQVSRLISPKYQWAKTVAAVLCAMTTNSRLGDPIDLSYRTCRCCIESSDCPSQVCSDGVCLSRKLKNGEPCPDFEDEDCENDRCALDSYPTGRYVCCPSNMYIPSLNTATNDYYCARTQAVGAPCSQREMCTNFRGCGRSSYPSGDYVCCGSFETVYSTATDQPYCPQTAGMRCDRDEMCSSGVCSGGVCMLGKLGTGQPCPDRQDGDCMSGVCSGGVCIPGRLGPGQPCPDGEDGDCLNGVCARSSYPSGGYVCCSDGRAVYSRYTGSYFCLGVPAANGSPCGANGMCTSGVCSSGVCIAGRIVTGQPCPDGEDFDCLNRACGRSSYPSGDYVCCSSGKKEYAYYTGEYYCRGDPAVSGSPCGANAMCLNKVCGRSSYPSGDFICCPSNSSVLDNGAYNEFCSGIQATGEVCKSNDMCSSGVCSGGVCSAERLGVGQACNTNNMCSSGVCSGGVCIAGKLGVGQACPDKEHDDCSNGACGVDPSGNYVCCASNSTWKWSRTRYCTNQEVGSRCYYDAVCSSGICSGGVCRAQRAGTGEPCADNNGCLNGNCGRGSYPSGAYICCPRSTTWSPTYEKFCNFIQKTGSPCFTNEICTSGVCSRGICLAERRGSGQACPDKEDWDCSNLSCGRSSYPLGRHICCPSNRTVYSRDEEEWYCTGQGVRSPCFSDEMCSSGICSGFACIAQKHGTGEECEDSNGCLNGACARASFPSGPNVCCLSNERVFDRVEQDYFCTTIQGNELPCNMNEMCISGVCSDGVCLSQKIGAGLPCPGGESDDCQNGACAKDLLPLRENATIKDICCPSNEYFWWFGSRIQDKFCKCFGNSTCTGGICVAHVCIPAP